MNSTKLQKLALLLPAIVFFAWLANLERAVRFAEIVRLKVTAYDPRDILSGRYLQYRIDYGDPSICTSREPQPCVAEDRGACEPTSDIAAYTNPNTEWCVCLTSGSEFSQAAWSGFCGTRPKVGCDLYLKGLCLPTGFSSNLERFYIPEWYEQHVRVVPEAASIDVAITADGHGTVREFYVGTQRLDEYVAAVVQANP